ncbi:DNA-formamidopyrimidine glycosylase family protein [Streptomyces sp. SL13]|uniref:DNA-(apurinic or apyrimidinic site) lyase n=1 Tax=Streptantibioticus silvisoli TaxID=2705255 RepID=A0AA90KB14_9ACTN|nr:DNA-formamidopyrimidine glycosylase family protein [Streptantibioticus silvisoli]MDI5973078.1 DNA-formamidopyrimidine glycosylase family protein [Streptantibioticus silvisoli]
MPEGDTVWLAARRLREALAGRVLTRADLRVPSLATATLTGRRVDDVVPRGKHLMVRLEEGWTLHSHLRMDGAWRIYAPGQRWRGDPDHQIRAILGNADAIAVGYRLPVLELLRTAEEDTAVGHLGPDLLGPDWNAPEAVRRLLTAPDRPVGEALLDQRNLAGIGNVYKCELCFLRGVTPWTPVGECRDPARMVALAHKLLDANKARHDHITTGDPRRGRSHWVYGRAHQPCLRCGTAIRRAQQGDPGGERVTYWCPSCQRGPAPPPGG